MLLLLPRVEQRRAALRGSLVLRDAVHLHPAARAAHSTALLASTDGRDELDDPLPMTVGHQ